MQSKLVALTLAVALAVSGTGLAAASVGPDTTDVPTPDDTDATVHDGTTDGNAADGNAADGGTANATRLTADESVSMSVGENSTVVDDDPIPLTVDESVTLNLSAGRTESVGDGLFVIELPDDGVDE